ncbi:hypothetical protein JCM8097_000291 [Rhodosporidiobolus ruineniae]
MDHLPGMEELQTLSNEFIKKHGKDLPASLDPMLYIYPVRDVKSDWFPLTPCEPSEYPRSYREYNSNVWEPWIEKVYADQKPFIEGRDGDFAAYLDPFSLSTAELFQQVAHEAAANLARVHQSNPQRTLERFAEWLTFPKAKQEEIIVQICELLHPKSATMYPTRRDAPDCTRPNLLAGGGQGLVTLVFACTLSASKPNLPLPPCDAFDRLFGLHKYSGGLPLSPQKRAYVHLQTAARRAFLFNFSLNWTIKMERKDKVTPTTHREAGFPLPFNQETAPRAFAALDDTGIERIQSCGAYHTEICCLSCHRRESSSFKLLLCTSCRKVGRDAHYCSAEHQKQHWKIHKQVCGKPHGAQMEERVFSAE